MDNFHLLRPEALWLILPLLLLLWLFARRRTNAGNWQKVCDEKLLPFVLQGQQRQQSPLPLVSIAIAGLLAIIALAGPAFEKIEQPVFRDQSALVIALDLSRSMDATDVSPTRLQRARLKLIDILKARHEGQTALIVYAANAYTVTPLTDDSNTIIAQISSLESEMMPQQGSHPDAAVAKASALLQQAGVRSGDILLITDGIYESQLGPTLNQLANQQHTLSVLAVGTPSGAPIKLRNGGFLQDSQGAIVIPKLDESPLQQLAQKGGGRYHRLTADDSDLNYLMAGFQHESPSETETSENLTADQWREEGPWLLLALLPLAAFAFRRGYLAVLLVVLFPIPNDAYAVDWSSLFLNKDQQGQKLLQQNDAAQAADTFESVEWQAAAHYRAGNYEKAAKLLENSNSAESHYNRGNALAKMNQFDDAIKAYEQALKLDPQNEDAKYNRDLLKQQQREQQQNGEQGDESGEGNEQQQDDNANQQSQDGQPQQGEQGEQQQGQQQQTDTEQQNQQGTQADEQQSSEEQQQSDEQQSAQQVEQQETDDAKQQLPQQAELSETSENEIATEQWLRRIPDDPGGLLRRKFRYQYQQQQPSEQQEQETW